MRPYLELFRVFLTPSALADSFAGYALAATLLAAPIEPLSVLTIAGASACLYWFGMATNDLFDIERDRAIAPARPLPSGALQPRRAAAAATVVGVLGIVLAFMAGAGAIAVGIALLALAYNGGAKHLPLVGNVLMGGARAGNLLLGSATVAGPGVALSTPGLAAAAAILGSYVGVVTAISVREHRPAPRALLLLSAALLAYPPLLVALQPRSALNWLNAAVLGFLLVSAIRPVAGSPRRQRAASGIVRRGLLGIFLLDAGLLLSLARDPGPPVWSVAVVWGLLAWGWSWRLLWIQFGGHDT